MVRAKGNSHCLLRLGEALPRPSIPLAEDGEGSPLIHSQKAKQTNQKTKFGAGEMAQHLGVLVLAEDPGSVPGTHMAAHDHL